MAQHRQDRTEEVIRLFAQEIPEVVQGIVEIKAIARKPGIRSKLALTSQDSKVDPVGVCVGVRGFRIKNIVDQLGSERIDLIRWVESPQEFICNALQPARIHAVILNHAKGQARVVVDEEQRSLAEGREGLNRELASRLCGWEIEVAAREDSLPDDGPFDSPQGGDLFRK